MNHKNTTKGAIEFRAQVIVPEIEQDGFQTRVSQAIEDVGRDLENTTLESRVCPMARSTVEHNIFELVWRIDDVEVFDRDDRDLYREVTWREINQIVDGLDVLDLQEGVVL